MAEIVKDYPPNYDLICKHIPAVKNNPAIVFTYGDKIYSPMFETLSDDLMAHELVHVERQKNPDEWWERYLTDVNFRLDEEVAAYRVQWQYMAQHYPRTLRRKLLNGIAKDLSGSMYGKIITKADALRIITG